LIAFNQRVSTFDDNFQVDIEGLRAGTQDWLGCPRDRKGPYSTWIRECRAYGDDGGESQVTCVGSSRQIREDCPMWSSWTVNLETCGNCAGSGGDSEGKCANAASETADPTTARPNFHNPGCHENLHFFEYRYCFIAGRSGQVNPRNGLVFENQVVRGDHPLYSGGPTNSPFVSKQFSKTDYTWSGDIDAQTGQITHNGANMAGVTITNTADFDKHYGNGAGGTSTSGARLRFDGLGNDLASDLKCPDHNNVDCDETYPARRTRTNSPMGVVQREKITGAGYEVEALQTGQVGDDANGIQATWTRECKKSDAGNRFSGNECDKQQWRYFYNWVCDVNIKTSQGKIGSVETHGNVCNRPDSLRTDADWCRMFDTGSNQAHLNDECQGHSSAFHQIPPGKTVHNRAVSSGTFQTYSGDQILPQNYADGDILPGVFNSKKYTCRQYTQGVDWRQFTEVECGVSAEEFWDCHDKDEWDKLERDRWILIAIAIAGLVILHAILPFHFIPFFG